LRVEPAAEVVARRKLMLANDVSALIATSYFRADLFGDTRMSEPEVVRPSLQTARRDLGYVFGRAVAADRPPPHAVRERDVRAGRW
jgi:hypothetical protein